MDKVYSLNEYELYEYVPTLFKPLAINFEKMRVVRRIRFFKEYMASGRYKVYYLRVNNEFVGHCVIAPGGRRLKCSTRDDVVIGPYYIDKRYRGKGYSTILIKLSIENCSYQFKYVYDWIDKNNNASIAATKKAGFIRIGELNVSRVLRRLTEVEHGEDIIFRYENGELQ